MDQALSLPQRPHSEGEWTLCGPTKNDAWVITAGAAQIALVFAHDVGAQTAAGNARLLFRAFYRHTMLEHILAELEGDDEGSRFGDLINMIRDELARTP